MKLKGTFALTLMDWALAAVVTNRASTVVDNINFVFIIVSFLADATFAEFYPHERAHLVISFMECLTLIVALESRR